jgi:hypothetical protein
MRSQFEDRPLPWLNDAFTPIEITADFDGSGDGVVKMTDTARRLTIEASANAPIVSARTKAITNSPSSIDLPPIRTVARHPTPPPFPRVPADGWDAPPNAPTTASGTPMAWSAEDDHPIAAPRPSMRKWILGAAGVVTLLLAVILIATRGSGSTTAANQPSTPEAQAPGAGGGASKPDPAKPETAASTATQAVDPAKPETAKPETAKPETATPGTAKPETAKPVTANGTVPPETVPGTTETPSKIAPKTPSKTTGTQKRGPKKKFDPNSLFIE